MSMISLEAIQKRLVELRNNPAMIKHLQLELFREVHDGKAKVMDASTPFGHALQMNALMGATMLNECHTVARQLYKSMAVSREEVYRHMVNRDYLGIFGSPSNTTIPVVFIRDELINLSKPIGEDGERRLVIPASTVFSYNEVDLGIHYPINIRILPQNAMKVSFDTSIFSPMLTLPSNDIVFREFVDAGIDKVAMLIPVQQFHMDSYIVPVNKSTGLVKNFNTSDGFYYARVYIKTMSNKWDEIDVTHSDDTFDPMTLTACCRVLDGGVQIRIPQIYMTKNMVTATIRVDIYTTRGEMNVDLAEIPTEHFAINWRDINKVSPEYSAPLNALTYLEVFGSDMLIGGTAELPFEQVREKVILSKSNKPVAVTPDDLKVAMSDKGYEIIKFIDNTTDRIYHASKGLPLPNYIDSNNGAESKNLYSQAGAMLGKVLSNVKALSNIDTSIKHAWSITLLPTTLYIFQENTVKLVTDQKRKSLSAMSKADLIADVNNNTYLYSPFHYVLDYSEDEFTSRAYYLNNPQLKNRFFVGENTSVISMVSLLSYSKRMDANGYTLYASVLPSQDIIDDDKATASIQLAFVPEGEKRRVYLNMTLDKIDADGVYNFSGRFDTNYDITRENSIDIDTFKTDAADTMGHKSALDIELDVFFIIHGMSNAQFVPYKPSMMDTIANPRMYEGNVMVLGHETLTFHLGSPLPYLSSSCRFLPGLMEYQRYDKDVMNYYRDTVYKTIPGSNGIREMRKVGDKMEYIVLHQKDAPVMIDGKHEILHYVGDVIRDPLTQEPVPIKRTEPILECELFLVEGTYLFADDARTKKYCVDLAETVVDYVNIDIANAQQTALSRCKIYLSPQRTIGNVEVYSESGTDFYIENNQSIMVDVYLNKVNHINIKLRNSITRRISEKIVQYLKRSTICTSVITTELTQLLGTDVVSVRVRGFGDGNRYETLSIINGGNSLAVRKRLELNPDNTTVLVEDITINYIRHSN